MRSSGDPAPADRNPEAGGGLQQGVAETVKVRRWWREPLLHFLLIGGALYALDASRSRPEAPAVEPIVVGPALAGAAPDAVKQFVEEEALYREALRLGLDRGDLIVRRRLVQKMEFLLDDMAAPAPPTDADLQAWLAAHPERYRTPRRVTLEHVYFSKDRRGAQAEADARAALAAPEQATGDPFMGGRRLERRTEQDLARELGSAFAAAAIQLEPGAGWQGPIASSFGFHLVRVVEVTPETPATLDEVRARLVADVTDARRQEAVAKARADLVKRYPVQEAAK
jgi:hypothetical protein